MGASNASIRAIIDMSVIKEGFGCSDEELFEKCRFDLPVRKALALFSLCDVVPSIDTYYLLRRRIYEYENRHGVNLMEKSFEQLTGNQLSRFKIFDKSVRMDSKLIGSNITGYLRHFSWVYQRPGRERHASFEPQAQKTGTSFSGRRCREDGIPPKQ